MRYLLLFFGMLLPTLAASSAGSIYFEPNLGQSGSRVRYVARARGAVALVEDDGIVLRNQGSQVRLGFENASGNGHWEQGEVAPGSTSYIVGRLPERWIHEVPHYRRLTRQAIYPGIDLLLYGTEGRLEFDFVARPGADPSRIELSFSGVRKLAIDSTGDLVADEVIQRRPRIYQGGREIAGGYRLTGANRVAFTIGKFDRSAPLTIDPVLESATYLGGAGDDRIIGANPANAIVGTTTSADFPGTGTGLRRGTDIFVYVPARQTTAIIGGSGDDIVTCASIGGSENAPITIGGYTNSPDFPVTTTAPYQDSPQPLQTTYGGGAWDGFLMSFYGPGSSPIFSTYVGGSGDDRVYAVFGNSGGYFAAAGSTSSSDFPVKNAWQSTAGGGTDGFVQVINSLGVLAFSTYVGGSGDDRVLAMVPSSTGRDIWIGGETRSPNWPGTLNGASDGFLLHATTDAALTRIQLAQAQAFGGSGDDRITALAVLPNGAVAAAGTTSSSDLPVVNATQSAFGGGSSDAFVAQFTADLKTLLAATYLGGSGDEEAQALATNVFNEMVVGGWTTSADFPVAGGDTSCGKGGEDGFVVNYDSDGHALLATCYGGKANDRVTAVASDGAQHVFAAGYSESPDLPLQDAVQVSNAGGADGFFASFTAPAIHAAGMSVGKDLAGAVAVSLGDSAHYIGVTLTATSSDASSVLLAARGDDPGQAAITLAKGTPLNFGSRNFLAYCLTDSATATVTLTAPGYAPRTINIRCVPSALYVGRTDITGAISGSIGVVPAAIDPETRQPLGFQNPRGGLDAIRIDAANSQPDVIGLGAQSLTIDQFTALGSATPPGFAFSLKTAGTGDISFSTASGFSFFPASTVHIRGNPSQFTGLFMDRGARDLMVRVWLGFATYPNAAFPVTFTSSDPSKVRISASQYQHGQDSLTVNYSTAGPSAWLEILDTGEVTITASSPGMDPVSAPVKFGDLAAAIVYPNSRNALGDVQLAPGQTTQVGIRVLVLPDDSPSYAPDARVVRPDAPDIRVSVSSSNSAVVKPDSFVYTTRTLSGAAVQTLTASAVGTTTVAVQPNAQLRASGSLTVRVDAPGIKMTPISVGNNLVANAGISVIGWTNTAPLAIKVTSSDPTRVLLGSDLQAPGQASVTLLNSSLFVHGLADSGTVEITATVDGFGSAKTTVTLNPSGFAWSQQGWITPYPYSTLGPILNAYMLDPATLIPMAPQIVRPGLGDSVNLVVADPAVGSVSPASVPLSSYNTYSLVQFSFSTVAGGDTTIAIVQPPGFVQPAGRGPLHLKASSPLLRSSWTDPGRNLQTAMQLQSSATSNPPITVTSGDPSRLLVSLNASFLGSGSVTANYRNGAYAAVYLQALDGPADVPVTLSADGAKDATVVVQIFPTTISLQAPYYPYDVVKANTQQESITLTAAVAAVGGQAPGPYNYPWTLRPGLDPIPLRVISTNASVAAVAQTPILNSLTSQVNVTVKPTGPGTTDLSIAPPPGFVAPVTGKAVHIAVDGPAFVMSDVTMGQDLEAPVLVQVQNGATTLTSDIDLTVTSGDASRLLLSASATAAGSGSITLHLLRGEPASRTVYLQAVGNSGQVAVGISAPGYGASTATVTLRRLTFVTDRSTLDQYSGYTLHVTPAPPTYGTYTYSQTGAQMRPGFAGFEMNVSSSNTNVATVAPQVLNWSAGTADLKVTVQAVSSGTAVVNFSAPASYTAPGGVNVTVTMGTLNVPSSLSLGKDLANRLGISWNGSTEGPAQVTVSSGDPSKVLVAGSATAAGQAAVDVAGTPGQQSLVWVQALASSGAVTLTFTAPGYKTAQMTVQLTQPEVTFRAPSATGTLTPLSPGVVFVTQLQTTPANYNDFPGTAVLRPGATPVQVPINLSDPSVGTVTPPSLTFNPGDSTQSFTFQARAPGSALLTLGVPAGFTDPVALRQQLLTVVQPRTSFSTPASTGKDLMRQTSLTLATPTGQNVSITLTSGDPARLLLGSTSNPAGGAQVTVTFVAGSSTSTAFTLIGLGGAGSVPVSIGAPLSPSSINVTLQPSAFTISQAPALLTANSTSVLVIAATTLTPGTLGPETALPLRPGIAPVSVSVISSDQAVIPSPAAIEFNAGDQQQRLTISGKSAGTATLSVQQPTGFSNPSTGASAVITVR